jgi:hypothetical protein
MSATFDNTWMWHPSFSEERTDTAGLFLHFRRRFVLNQKPPKSLKVHCTADTRYKLYVNQHLVSFGPVKGDQHLWFYDDVDIGPFLRQGSNQIAIHVLRFFAAAQYSPSFPRLPSGGVRVAVPDGSNFWEERLCSGPKWQVAVDPFASLRIDEPEDMFLHTYEYHSRYSGHQLEWVPASNLSFKNSTGNAPPWKLCQRLIPPHRLGISHFTRIHNLQSSIGKKQWANLILDGGRSSMDYGGLLLPAGSVHIIELGVDSHTTAYLRFIFQRPKRTGSKIQITYSEGYEDEPDLYKGERRKAHRLDTTKKLLGPKDVYHLQDEQDALHLGYYNTEEVDDIFIPFHWRTFRVLRLEISAGSSDLLFKGVEAETINYALDVQASFKVQPEASLTERLWHTSLRTLTNCMHDCYEDCPFYEQLQYAMDTRSSCLFTYYVSGDGRLARQAIIQLHNTFQSSIGLICSRAPTNRQQFIPHFSLYWIGMLGDYLDHFGDVAFLKRFLPVVDAILSYFHMLIDPDLGLVQSEQRPGIWNYVDWTAEWKPYGIPPGFHRTGISTYTNELYAYTLNIAAALLAHLGRPTIAEEYTERAESIVCAIRKHCFDGEYFTDSLATNEDSLPVLYSQHGQIWAVLSGVTSGIEAQNLLRNAIAKSNEGKFVKVSISMSFYTLRALSMAGGGVYEEHYREFWRPWQTQLDLGLTTWWEDEIAQRSDCHAWGSLPLYEFPAEVAGVQPAAPGWTAINFKPRLSLYQELDAIVPMSTRDGLGRGSVIVSWTTISEPRDAVEVRIKLKTNEPCTIPIRVSLPGMEITLEENGREFSFRVIGSKSMVI